MPLSDKVAEAVGVTGEVKGAVAEEAREEAATRNGKPVALSSQAELWVRPSGDRHRLGMFENGRLVCCFRHGMVASS